MKTIMSAFIALSALAVLGAPASAAWTPGDLGGQHAQAAPQVQQVIWTDQDQKRFWEEEGDRG